MDDKVAGKIFDKIDEMNKLVSDIRERLVAIETIDAKRETPSPSCRVLFSKMESYIREKSDDCKTDIDSVATSVRGRVRWSMFWLFISASFVFTIGSYIYTWNTNSRIDEYLLRVEKNEKD